MATALTVAGVVPNYLLGALAIPIRRDIGFSIAQLGILIALFHGTAALFSAQAGHLVEQRGARWGARAGACSTIVALGATGLLARTWWHLVLCAVAGGIGSALSHPAANLQLASQVRVVRQGLVFGLKQAAVPTAAFFAGIAVPVTTWWIGWRWVFAFSAVTLLAFAWWSTPMWSAHATEVSPSRRKLDAVRIPPLVVIAVAMTGAGASVSSVTTFMVASAVARGLSAPSAGMLLALASTAAIVVRVASGWLADWRGERHLVTVIKMSALGTTGLLVAALAPTPLLFGIGALIGIGVGWGWNGLFHYAIVHYHREAPAIATSITQSGLFFGGAIGPLTFGLLVEHVSYAAAWLVAAAELGIATVGVAIGRRMLRSALEASGYPIPPVRSKRRARPS